MAERLLDEQEGRRALGGLGRTKYFELLRTRQLRSVKIGRRRMVPASEIDAYIARRMAEETTPAA